MNESKNQTDLPQGTPPDTFQSNPSRSSVEEKIDPTSEHLSELLQHIRQLTHTVQEQAKRLAKRQRSSRTFLRKMATEVPPVVLAVLLAFGINSWWQQRRADQLAEQALANIITESRSNLKTYENILERDQRNLSRLERQITNVMAGSIDLDTLYRIGYGQGINVFTLSEGAWQAATLTGGIEGFDPELIQEASDMYSEIHSRNIRHAGFDASGYERYREETLLAALIENRVTLTDHISNCTSEAYVVRSFLEKYDPTFESEQ